MATQKGAILCAPPTSSQCSPHLLQGSLQPSPFAPMSRNTHIHSQLQEHIYWIWGLTVHTVFSPNPSCVVNWMNLLLWHAINEIVKIVACIRVKVQCNIVRYELDGQQYNNLKLVWFPFESCTVCTIFSAWKVNKCLTLVTSNYMEGKQVSFESLAMVSYMIRYKVLEGSVKLQESIIA